LNREQQQAASMKHLFLFFIILNTALSAKAQTTINGVVKEAGGGETSRC